MIRVLVVDDEPMLREVLVRIIDREPGLEFVGSAGDADEAIELAALHHPDVALVDVKIPGGGQRAAREIRAVSPRTKLLAFSAYEDQATVMDMMRAGVTGYLVKGTSLTRVVDAIRRVAHGEGTISESITSRLMLALGGQLEREHVALEAAREQAERIRRVIGGDAVSVLFQPIADLRTGCVVGVEALCRFTVEPYRPPNVWFAEAAAAGLLLELELVAIRAAIARAGTLPPDTYLSVNISPSTVVTGPLTDLLRGVRREMMVEITEHAPVEDYDQLVEALDGLRARGVRVAVDDAGAGFSSLHHILRISPDVIKLDVSLTEGIHEDRSRRALAAALISFADEIEAVIVAEGIERHSELETLRSLGVPCGQGYYLGRPGTLPEAALIGTAAGDG